MVGFFLVFLLGFFLFFLPHPAPPAHRIYSFLFLFSFLFLPLQSVILSWVFFFLPVGLELIGQRRRSGPMPLCVCPE